MQQSEGRKALGDQMLTLVFLLWYLLYPSNSANIFATLQCEDLDDPAQSSGPDPLVTTPPAKSPAPGPKLFQASCPRCNGACRFTVPPTAAAAGPTKLTVKCVHCAKPFAIQV